MIASHRYSPSKTGGSYHALVLASKYATLTTFSVEHALTCKTGGFLAVRHNEERDITTTLLSKVFHRVTIEPHLQPLSGESLSYRSAITEDGACLDIATYMVLGRKI